MNETTILSANKVTFQTGTHYLVKSIDWEVRPGENWIVFGMNGCGKTTLLSMIAGFRQPTSGHLTVFGQKYSNENILSLRRQIGFVSSSFFDLCYGSEPILEIVLSGLSGTLGVEHDFIDNTGIKKAKALLTEFGLEDKIYYPYNMLSKGQRQCVLIARSLITKPKLLLLDEPCSGLDLIAKYHLHDKIKNWIEDGLSIVYVTHDINEIDQTFSHALLLRQGTIYAKGETSTLFTETTMSDFFSHPIHIAQTFDGKFDFIPKDLAK